MFDMAKFLFTEISKWHNLWIMLGDMKCRKMRKIGTDFLPELFLFVNTCH